MNNPERDKFYRDPPSPPSDDDEYELEEPDPAVEEARRQAVLQSLEHTIDINEVYREAERDRAGEILNDWVRNFRFQYRVKHLLMATAVVAIALALAKLQLFWTALIVLIMLSVAGLYFYLSWEDSKHQAEAERKREELYAKRRAKLGAQTAGHVVGSPVTEPARAIDAAPPAQNETDRIWEESSDKEAFRFQFSLRELILAMTAVAIVLGTMHWLGGPAVTATVLGTVALVGLVVFALGYEPPHIVVFGWWFTLALYVVVILIAAVWVGMT
jgi:hypothetical protein